MMPLTTTMPFFHSCTDNQLIKTSLSQCLHRHKLITVSNSQAQQTYRYLHRYNKLFTVSSQAQQDYQYLHRHNKVITVSNSQRQQAYQYLHRHKLIKVSSWAALHQPHQHSVTQTAPATPTHMSHRQHQLWPATPQRLVVVGLLYSTFTLSRVLNTSDIIYAYTFNGFV